MLKSSKYLLLLLAIPFLLAANYHKFYLSLFQFKYAKAEKSLQCTAKIFTDDLELALKKNGMEVSLGKTLPDSVEKALFHYTQKHTHFNSGNKSLSWKWVGYEQENDVCFIYIESKLDSLPPKASIQVDFLHEVYDDQINLVHFEANGTKQSFNLSKRNPSVQLSLQ
ncbi:MAG: hypothetical protein EP332_12595 [Bacteroidetes bacterium]|nr:MAG: hypothetical protein EP332_12595 [Bacteroidota bacterium]